MRPNGRPTFAPATQFAVPPGFQATHDFDEQGARHRQYTSKEDERLTALGYLRLVHSAPPVPTPESGCLDAYDRELDYIFASLRRLGAAPDEIEDLAQELFMVLHRHWRTLDTSRPLRPYLFGIAFRIVCAHRRRWSREIPCPDLETDDGAATPEGSLQSKEAAALLLAALEGIPISRRAVVVMHDLDEVPIAEVARTLSMSRFGVYARLRKGRRELAAAVRRLLKGGARR
jgi:RNA polymerase sigma-70 factor, ECF subfamily